MADNAFIQCALHHVDDCSTAVLPAISLDLYRSLITSTLFAHSLEPFSSIDVLKRIDQFVDSLTLSHKCIQIMYRHITSVIFHVLPWEIVRTDALRSVHTADN